MWELLPIQTNGARGLPFTLIQPDFPYPRASDVHILPWKDVPGDIQQWAQTIWEDIFQCIRVPVSPDDLFAWIPGTGHLTARKARWVDTERSFCAVFVDHIYVTPSNRHRQTASKLILSLCHESVRVWGIQCFAFELEHVPSSLRRRSAVPFLRYDYMWIPFFPLEEPWRLLDKAERNRYLSKLHGFHSRFAGWCVHEHPQSKNKVVLDSHNDIVWYDSLQDVLQCHIPHLHGAYMRVFNPMGKCFVFVENLYFSSTGYSGKLV